MNISLDDVKEKLDRISDVWFHFVWDYRFLRTEVNFNDETSTTFFGDILTYFGDTFELLSMTNNSKTYQENTFFFTGLMQIIYVQQDLVEELMYAFKLDRSKQMANDPDRSINRNLRNELIGHPIRRSKEESNSLVSSVIFGNQLSNEKIHYVLYARENEFKGQEVEHKLTEIIERHITFLNRYFDFILEKIKIILDRFNKKILELQKVVKNGSVSFESKLELVGQLFESIFKENYLYKKEILIEVNKRYNEHHRYKFAMEMFLSELEDLMIGKMDSADELLAPKRKPLNINEFVPPKINIVFSNDPPPKDENEKRDYGYELGKLMSKHPIWGVSYFKEQFSHDKTILEELDNMTFNEGSDLEYYCSYEYLRHLILKDRNDL